MAKILLVVIILLTVGCVTGTPTYSVTAIPNGDQYQFVVSVQVEPEHYR